MSALTILCFLASDASAAEVTDMAPRLGMLAGIGYDGSSLNGGLAEDGQRISDRRIQRHDLNLSAEFAPVRGVAATLEVAITPSLTYSYPDSRVMVLEPTDGSGSYLAGEVSPETPSIRASGVQGVWLGGALAPFFETKGPANRSTWRLDLAFRTPSPGRNLWTAPSGTRGPAPGGSAIRVVGAFSIDRGVGNPYLTAHWLRENGATIEVIDEDGVTWADELEIQPADEFGLRAGAEIVGFTQPDTQTRFAVDTWLGAAYRSWEDVASGVYLPNVLDGARSIPVTVGEHLKASAGLALDYHVNAAVRGRTGLEFTYHTPFRPEHVYPVVTTADTWQIGWFLKLQGVPVFDGS